MKKSILAFMLVITMILCLTSCGKDKQLTARVDSLEVNVKELTARVDSLESKVKELEEFKLSDSFYGSIYKIDDRSWDALVAFYDSHEECKNESYSDPYYYVWNSYEEGKDVYLMDNAITIGFKNDSILTMTVSGMALDMEYSMMGNDVMIDMAGFAKLSGQSLSSEQLEAMKAMKMNLGTLSEDKTSLTLTTEVVDFGVLFLQ